MSSTIIKITLEVKFNRYYSIHRHNIYIYVYYNCIPITIKIILLGSPQCSYRWIIYYIIIYNVLWFVEINKS